MPDGMPFMKQKGNPLHDLERWLPKTRAGAWAMLVEAHNPNIDVGDLLLTHLADNGAGNTPAIVALVEHIRVDWFGEWLPVGAAPEKQPLNPGQAGGDGEPVWETGHWKFWFGNAEEIVRAAIIRTAELLLHLDPVDYPQEGVPLVEDKDVEEQYGLAGPIVSEMALPRLDVWWICPQPRFEAAVERNPECVRLEFLTPAPENGVLGSGYREDRLDPFTAETPPEEPEDISDVIEIVGKGGDKAPLAVAKDTAEPTESWIIGQNKVTPLWFADATRVQGQEPYVILNPFTIMYSSGPPATVDPTKPFGGRP